MTQADNAFLSSIHDILLERYGKLHWWPADTPFEVCVGAILTQNTNWGNVEKAIVRLKHEQLLTPGAILEAPLDRLAEAVRPSGFFQVKSKRLKEFVSWLVAHHDGSLAVMAQKEWQALRAELLLVNGVGRETCDSILLYACGHPTFVVDAYTKRIFSRLGLLAEESPYEEVRSLFMDHLPPDAAMFNDYHALIVEHAKKHCRKVPLCAGCCLLPLCNFPKQT